MSITIAFRRMLFLLCCTVPVAADSDTRTVQAEFERCEAVMERLDRAIRRYEDAVTRIIRTFKRTTPAGDDQLRQEAAALENRLEYFRNRFERARGQEDKISGDLRNVSGPACPSCIASGVNMYCRNGETLQNSLDEYLARAHDLLNRMNTAPTVDDSTSAFAQHRAAIDSLHRSLGTCDAPAALPLIRQTRVNLLRADSLLAAGMLREAQKTLSIAGTLAEKAAERCNAR